MKGLGNIVFSRVALAALLQAGMAAGAMACEGQSGNVIFEDTFPDDSGGWELFQDRDSVVPPNFLITLPEDDEGIGHSSLNLTFEATEADFCTEFVWPQDPLPQDSYLGAGLMFWAADYDNHYLLQAHSTGKVGLYRKSNGKWNTIFEVADSGVVKPAPEVNTVRALAKGGKITAFVNGQQIKAIRAPMPQNAPRFGLYAESGKLEKPVAIHFSSYLVTEGG
jgi:hypothetical protein